MYILKSDFVKYEYTYTYHTNAPLGESMVFYIYKSYEKISSLKRDSFHENMKKYIQFLIKFHFETMVLSIGFILKVEHKI
jgi:hypothetical protein